jgi:hypothetical protein
VSGKPTKFLVYTRGDGAKEVVRFEFGQAGWEPVTKHVVVGGACDCDGFKHRNDCQHLTAASEKIEGRAATVGEARMVARDLRKTFVGLLSDREEYDKNEQEDVTCVRMKYFDGEGRTYTGTVGGIKFVLQGVLTREELWAT